MASPPLGTTCGPGYLSIGVPVARAARDAEYYYTLAFPSTSSSEPGDVAQGRRLQFAETLAILRAVTAGGKEREAQVLTEFRSAWVAKFRSPPPSPGDTIPQVYFQELVRELVVQRFDAIPDLFMKTTLSADGQLLYISFRPSKELLQATADRLRVQVAIMKEIDPGEDYWSEDPSLAATETHRWSRSDAQEELYRMFLAGRIPVEEAQIFDQDGDREDEGMWSRRIHALRRFSSPQVKNIVLREDASSFPTYLPYKSRPSLQYLYRQIDGVAEDITPFRVVDKIRLTKAIIDAEFDCDALVEKKLLVQHFCVHTHNVNEVDTSIHMMRVHWGHLLSPIRLYRQVGKRISQLFDHQPLVHLRNYFGEEVALYFAYTSFYARSLQWLCIAAVTIKTSEMVLGSSFREPLWSSILFSVLCTTFTQVFVRKWEIQERILGARWGIDEMETYEVIRPQFRGQLSVSRVSLRLETYYSPRRRQVQQILSAAVLIVLCISILALDVAVLTSNSYKRMVSSSEYIRLIVHVLFAAMAKYMGEPLASLCTALNNWENYKTHGDYELHLTLKFAFVLTVNLFGMLWIMTFVLPLLTATNTDLSHTDSAHFFEAILCYHFVCSIWELRHALTQCWTPIAWSSHPRQKNLAHAHNTTDRSQLLRAVSPIRPLSAFDMELELIPYEGVMTDYAQVIITFGFVACFAALSPITTLLAWGIAIIQIRVDAFKLCEATQRPFPRHAASIGSWLMYLRFLACCSWIHNAMFALLQVLSQSEKGYASLQVFLHLPTSVEVTENDRLILETNVLCFLFGFFLVSLLAGLPDHTDRSRLHLIRRLQVRRQFLQNKYINSLDLVSDAVRDSLPSGQVYLNGIHLYIVTGNTSEEDAAEEILDELIQLQVYALELQKHISEFREKDASVGSLVVEVGSINILPVMDSMTKAVDSFLQLQVVKSDAERVSERKAPPVNTAVIKKNRSPQWTETFELSLNSLDDKLLIKVYDWELLGKNRRIGRAMLEVSDIVATASPSFGAIQHVCSDSPARLLPERSTAQPTTVRMASFEVAFEMPNALLSSMRADLVKHGYPKLTMRCGLQLEALGRLLLQERHVDSKVRHLKEKEKQFFEWK